MHLSTLHSCSSIAYIAHTDEFAMNPRWEVVYAPNLVEVEFSEDRPPASAPNMLVFLVFGFMRATVTSGY
jgi:hypothetical protein